MDEPLSFGFCKRKNFLVCRVCFFHRGTVHVQSRLVVDAAHGLESAFSGLKERTFPKVLTT